MDGKLQEEYEDRLQKALNELRDVYDKQMAQNREDFGKLYESRVQELQTALTSERGKASSSTQALEESRARIEGLVAKVSSLEADNLSLTQKITDLGQKMEDQNAAHRAQVRLCGEEKENTNFTRHVSVGSKGQRDSTAS